MRDTLTGCVVPGCVGDGAWMAWRKSSAAAAVAHLGLIELALIEFALTELALTELALMELALIELALIEWALIELALTELLIFNICFAQKMNEEMIKVSLLGKIIPLMDD